MASGAGSRRRILGIAALAAALVAGIAIGVWQWPDGGTNESASTPTTSISTIELTSAQAPPPVRVKIPAGETPFRANFEVQPPGWQQFTGLQYEEARPLGDSFSLVTSPVREGTTAARFTVKQGYSRFGANEDTEAVWHSHERQGDDYWYAWSTLFPTNWEPPYGWGIFAQWHAPLGTSPIISFNARADTAVLDVHTGLTDEKRNAFAFDHEFPLLGTLAKGRWNDFVMHVHWSRKADGVIEVFHRLAGATKLRRLVTLTHIPTFQFTASGTGTGTYLLLGLYRRSYCSQPTQLDCRSRKGVQPPSVVYDDAFARGRSFNEAVRRAFPDSLPELPAR